MGSYRASPNVAMQAEAARSDRMPLRNRLYRSVGRDDTANRVS